MKIRLCSEIWKKGNLTFKVGAKEVSVILTSGMRGVTSTFKLWRTIGSALFSMPKSWTDTMKIKNSLKSLKGRHRANRVVRRRGRVYVINKQNPRFKARQG